MSWAWSYCFEQEFTVALSRTEDAREARNAFLEKRAPVFKGRWPLRTEPGRDPYL